MKFLAFSSATLPVLVAAHAHNELNHHARQAQSSSAVASAAGAVSSAAASGATTPAASIATATASFSLASSNPTAVPLSSIGPNEPSVATIPLSTTQAPGSKPSFISNAPSLPDPASIKAANYPALDVTPPVDSDEVKQWIQEVADSGVSIPDIKPTVAGGCAANAEAAADSSRCWWTCGGCTRDSDVTTCPDKLTWGLTYDDGPGYYTPNLLAYLDERDIKSTFFVVGSRVISFPAILQDEYMTGHQVAVHTWAHPALTTLSNEQIIAELGWTRKAIKDVLGVAPNMMRPPYGDIDDRVRAISLAMGMYPVMWTRISATATFDTDDFNLHAGSTTSSQVLHNWKNIISNASSIDTGFIVLEHDLFEQTVQIATGYILPDALAQNPAFDIKPVISCLNKPMADAYIETNDNSTNPPAASGTVVTLSSGQPGSAEATSSSDNSNSAVKSSSLSIGFSMGSASVVLGVASLLLQ